MEKDYTPDSEAFQKMLAEEKAKLKPGQWLDNMPDPLHTKEDVEDLLRRVKKLKAELLAEAIERATRD